MTEKGMGRDEKEINKIGGPSHRGPRRDLNALRFRQKKTNPKKTTALSLFSFFFFVNRWTMQRHSSMQEANSHAQTTPHNRDTPLVLLQF